MISPFNSPQQIQYIDFQTDLKKMLFKIDLHHTYFNCVIKYGSLIPICMFKIYTFDRKLTYIYLAYSSNLRA